MFNVLRNSFSSKAIKICLCIIFNINNILIKSYFICPILHLRWISSCINTILNKHHSICSFEIVNVVVHCAESRERTKANTFLWKLALAADAVAVNPNGMSALLANGLISKRIFINDARSQPTQEIKVNHLL